MAELKGAYAGGETSGDCLCWNESMAGWTAIKDCPDLMALIKPPVAAAAPPRPAPAPKPFTGQQTSTQWHATRRGDERSSVAMLC